MEDEPYLAKSKRLLRQKWRGLLWLGGLFLLLLTAFPTYLPHDWRAVFLYLLTTVPMNLKFNMGLAISSFAVSLFYMMCTPLVSILVISIPMPPMPRMMLDGCVSIVLACLAVFTVLLFRKIYYWFSDISRVLALFVMMSVLIIWYCIMVGFNFVLFNLYALMVNHLIIDGLIVLLIIWKMIGKSYPRLFLFFAVFILCLTILFTSILPAMYEHFDIIPSKVILPKPPVS